MSEDVSARLLFGEEIYKKSDKHTVKRFNTITGDPYEIKEDVHFWVFGDQIKVPEELLISYGRFPYSRHEDNEGIVGIPLGKTVERIEGRFIVKLDELNLEIAHDEYYKITKRTGKLLLMMYYS